MVLVFYKRAAFQTVCRIKEKKNYYCPVLAYKMVKITAGVIRAIGECLNSSNNILSLCSTTDALPPSHSLSPKKATSPTSVLQGIVCLPFSLPVVSNMSSPHNRQVSKLSAVLGWETPNSPFKGPKLLECYQVLSQAQQLTNLTCTNMSVYVWEGRIQNSQF